ncbi:reverse transcriptase-like protein [Rossellomorea marisflavi]|uniref:Reverse transcriptase-like protein n=2 Tax=Rossellomorea marisflavi TaxID=189381 RepID=A0A5D4S3U0_9BACI|nr:reverse transcriptase-like protein [Rossellomorea marisflavi]
MDMRIRFTYKTKTKSSIEFESSPFPRKETLIHVDDLMKTGRVLDLEIIDEMGSSWTRKEFIKLNEELEKEPENIRLYFDGGFDKESSMTGIGIVIYYEKGGEGFRIRRNDLLDSLENNNEAEYAALHYALSILQELGVKNQPCAIYGDSQVVLNQLGGEWPCYEAGLAKWLERTENLIKKIRIKTTLHLIGRKDNKEADKLANQALEGTRVESHKSLE